MTLKQLRRSAIQTLRENHIESPETESGLLISYALGVKRSDLIGRDFEIPKDTEDTIRTCLRRRIAGEPIQYILGSCGFMSLTFTVTPATLIPRPDTEILVEAVLKRLPADAPTILDIGCGSGCIGLSLAHYAPAAQIIELDISKAALSVAQQNAAALRVSDRVVWMEHDILSSFPALPEPPDCIVSNPPYIRRAEIAGLQTEVKAYEPQSALDGGIDGLDFYRAITRRAVLQPGGLLAFEVGIGQAGSVRALLQEAGYSQIEILPDLAGIDRVVLGRFVQDTVQA